MRWDREQWVKLYRREVGSFALLPLYVRSLAGELLKFTDEQGRIFVGAREPWEAIARLCGATTGERRMLRKDIPILIADGYLVLDGGHLVIRNLVKAQGRGAAKSATPLADPSGELSEPETNPNEPIATDERVEHEPERTESESSTSRNEPDTKNDLSARHDSGHTLAGARAHSEEIRGEESRLDPPKAPRGVGGPDGDGPVAQDPVHLSAVGEEILRVLREGDATHPLATAKFAEHLQRLVDESGEMPGGRPLPDALHAIRQADDTELRSRALGEEPRSKKALAGLIVAKVRDAKRGDAERAAQRREGRADAPPESGPAETFSRVLHGHPYEHNPPPPPPLKQPVGNPDPARRRKPAQGAPNRLGPKPWENAGLPPAMAAGEGGS